MKRKTHREFVSIGEEPPKVEEHKDFQRLIQQAIICSLEQRRLLTARQRTEVEKYLEKRNRDGI